VYIQDLEDMRTSAAAVDYVRFRHYPDLPARPLQVRHRGDFGQ